MNKKRIAACAVAALLLVSVSACNEKAPTNTNSPETTVASAVSAITSAETTASASDTVASEATEITSGSDSTTAAAVNDVENRIAVTLPDGWTAVDGSVLKHQYMKGTASFILKNETLYQSTELKDVAEECMGYMESAFDNVTRVGEIESLKVAGQDATKVTFTADVSGISMKFTYFFFYVDNQLLVGTVGTLADDYSNMEADFNQIMTSGISIKE